ncbi:hypothetical protein ACQY0O_004872 [Thecaphora frezii]
MERDAKPNHAGTLTAVLAEAHPHLPIAEVGLANKQAQMRGMLIGLAGGLCSALISRKALNLNANQSVLSGLVAATGVAYVAARQELTHNLENLEKSLNIPSSSQGDEAEMTELDLRSAHERQFDAGVAGLHEFKDPAATTRGDH